MLGDNRDRIRTKEWIKAHLVLSRRSGGGSIGCSECGLPALTKFEFAQLVGISPSTLAKFLNRQVIRQDIADKIRASVKAVREGNDNGSTVHG